MTYTFDPITELVIPKGIPSKVVKVEIKIHPVVVEANGNNFKEIISSFIYNY